MADQQCTAQRLSAHHAEAALPRQLGGHGAVLTSLPQEAIRRAAAAIFCKCQQVISTIRLLAYNENRQQSMDWPVPSSYI